eukprot:3248372-Alexandrium_andersonii.AAC.1
MRSRAGGVREGWPPAQPDVRFQIRRPGLVRKTRRHRRPRSDTSQRISQGHLGEPEHAQPASKLHNGTCLTTL